MRSYKIHLIRHGLTNANKEGRYIGCKTDISLNTDAKRSIKGLMEDYGYPSVPLVFSSPLKRCIETAQIIYPGKEIITVDNLREYDFGDFENKTAAELEGRPDYIAWTSGKMPSTPNGESSKDFTARVVLGFNEVVRRMMDEDETEAAVIMHGGAIMMLLAACGLPKHPPVDWTSEPGCGYTVIVTPSLYQKAGIIEVTEIIPNNE